MVSRDVPTTIRKATEQCLTLLEKCPHQKTLAEDQWAENRLAEFRLWINGIGALAGPKASLDARLEFEPDVREFMIQQLILLGILLDNCLNIEDLVHDKNGSPPDHDATHEPGGLFDSAMQDVDSILDELSRYAFAIKRSGTSSRIRKADRSFNTDAESDLHDHLTLLLLARPTILDRLRTSIRTRTVEDLDDCDLSFDLVQKRLINANLRRRHRFRYAQNHSLRLEAPDIPQFVAIPSSDNVTKAKTDSVLIATVTIPETSAQLGSIPKQRAVTDTTASLVDPVSIKALPKGAPPSQQARTEISTTASKINYPSPPKHGYNDGSFKCPCCCQRLPIMYAETQRWRKHIAEDVCPYLCVLGSCPHPETMYSSKEAWLKHIQNDHPQIKLWHCILCSTQSYDVSTFKHHVELKHSNSIYDISTFANVCETTAPPDIISCPLCAWAEDQTSAFDTTALLDHIAEHIHSFALRSLPWASDTTDRTAEAQKRSKEIVVAWRERLFSSMERVTEEAVGDIYDLTAKGVILYEEAAAPLNITDDADTDIDPIRHLNRTIFSPTLQRQSDVRDEQLVLSNNDRYFASNEYFNEDAATSSAISAKTSIFTRTTTATDISDQVMNYEHRAFLVLTDKSMSGDVTRMSNIMTNWYDFKACVREHQDAHPTTIVDLMLAFRDICEPGFGPNDSRSVSVDAEKVDSLVIVYYAAEANVDANTEDLMLKICHPTGNEKFYSCDRLLRWLTLTFKHSDIMLILDCHLGAIAVSFQQRMGVTLQATKKENMPSLKNLWAIPPSWSPSLSQSVELVSYRDSNNTPDSIAAWDMPWFINRFSGAFDQLRLTKAGFTASKICCLMNKEELEQNGGEFEFEFEFICSRRGGLSVDRDITIVPTKIDHAGRIAMGIDHFTRDRYLKLPSWILHRIQSWVLRAVVKIRSQISVGLSVNIRLRLRRWAQTARRMVAARIAWGLSVGSRIRLRRWARDSRQRALTVPLWRAIRAGEIEVVRLLLDRGANIEAKDSHNMTPLHRSVQDDRKEVVQLLLDRGANIEARDLSQKVPLHWAASHGKIEVIQLLLRAGANMKVEDSSGRTPLHLAVEGGNLEVIQLLLDRGGNTDISISVGNKLRHWLSDARVRLAERE